MALLGLSLILASLVYALVRPPAWLLALGCRASPAATAARARVRRASASSGPPPPPPSRPRPAGDDAVDAPASRMTLQGPSPSPSPPPVDDDPATTPRASATRPPPAEPAIPSLCLLSDESPPPAAAATFGGAAGADAAAAAATAMMPPPPLPSRLARPPTLARFPAANSPQRASAPGPVPDRRPAIPPRRAPGPAAGLAPPPTLSSRPPKRPSRRKVVLEPGRSPLDWARVAGPGADLRGLPPATPYLRVPPSMLGRQTGRGGSDAWMAINGKVYNVTPYAEFHPGGVPELMRGAGRDATTLFGEIHPWVNYEAMLAACFVGLLVDEPGTQASAESEMDAMD